MKLYYVKIDKDWDELDAGDSVIFELPTKELKYRIYIYPNNSGFILTGEGCSNDMIFKELDIDGNFFAQSILGYINIGCFPEVKYLDDLKKVIKALDDECVKKFGMPKEESTESKPKFKVGDKVRILPRIKAAEDYYPAYLNGMAKHAGVISCVEEVSSSGHPKVIGYYYPPEALELLDSSSIKNPFENYNIFCDTTQEKPKEELNLFPTKKHYQLNFNY